MVTHSSILAWKMLWTKDPCGLQSIGSHRVRHNQVIKQIHTADSEEKNINSGLSHIHRSFPLAPGYHGASLSSSNVFILTS